MNTTVQDGLPPFVVMVTGQVGGDKGSFLKQVWDIVATRSGRTAELFEVGPRMYDEDPTVPFPRILDLPHQRLRALRRAVMQLRFGAQAAS